MKKSARILSVIFTHVKYFYKAFFIVSSKSLYSVNAGMFG